MNIAEDEKQEYELQDARFNILLSFISPDGAKKYREMKGESSSNIELENTGPADSENFFEDVKSLPSRRVLNSGPHDPYIANKRSKENLPELRARTANESDKPVVLTRRIIVRDKNNG